MAAKTAISFSDSTAVDRMHSNKSRGIKHNRKMHLRLQPRVLLKLCRA